MPIIDKINAQIVNPIILLLFGVALLYFLYGLVEYLAKKDIASSNRKELYDRMIYGVIGLTIMISVFGIMEFIINTVTGLSGS